MLVQHEVGMSDDLTDRSSFKTVVANIALPLRGGGRIQAILRRPGMSQKNSHSSKTIHQREVKVHIF